MKYTYKHKNEMLSIINFTNIAIPPLGLVYIDFYSQCTHLLFEYFIDWNAVIFNNRLMISLSRQVIEPVTSSSVSLWPGASTTKLSIVNIAHNANHAVATLRLSRLYLSLLSELARSSRSHKLLKVPRGQSNLKSQWQWYTEKRLLPWSWS